MDIGISLESLASVRVAVVPVGPISDERYTLLAGHIASLREVPLSALPRKTPSVVPSASAKLPSIAAANNSASQSRSLLSDFTHARASNSAAASAHDTGANAPMHGQASALGGSGTGAAGSSSSASIHAASTNGALSAQSVDDSDSSSVLLRYEIVRRDHTGSLLAPPADEWEIFHSSKKVWGVIGIVDVESNNVDREAAISKARKEFSAALAHFRNAVVSRVIVFSPFSSPAEGSPARPGVDTVVHKEAVENSDSRWISIGFVPDMAADSNATAAEVRAQLHHFVHLVLDALESWTRRANLTTGMVLSPLDAQYSVDKASKLQKRRQGRLDKLYGDYFLLMGSHAEAQAKYSASAERSRANSDRLWLAGALEGAVTSQILQGFDGSSVDRFVEQYDEVYKLYQKKRTPDLEVSAAMRMAEFLSGIQGRRKDSLEAAAHCAAVAEALPPQMKAAVWSSLAKFSMRMGCRRKAAAFLYRLARYNSQRGMHAEAHALAAAGAGQFRQGQWPSLHRAVILESAASALDAASTTEAARKCIEALNIPRDISSGAIGDRGSRYFGTGSDEEILKRLGSVPVPDLVSEATSLITVQRVGAVKTDGLSITVVKNDEVPEVSGNKGPFIYSAMDAAKDRAEAERAGRVATWLCHEKARLQIHFQCQCFSSLKAEILAVVVEDEEMPRGPAVENAGNTRSLWEEVREANEVVRTVPEIFKVNPSGSSEESLVRPAVTPKKTGRFRVCGIIVSMFGGSLFRLPVPCNEEDSATISVVPRIPLTRVEVVRKCGQLLSEAVPLTIYEGERWPLVAKVSNGGPGSLATVRVSVATSSPSLSVRLPEILAFHDVDEGDSRSVDFEVMAESSRLGEQPLAYSGHCSVLAEYWGASHANILRATQVVLPVVIQPAVRIERASCLQMSAYLAFVLEMSNPVAGPMKVQICSTGEASQNMGSHSEASQIDLPSSLLLEPGGSVHLMAPLRTPLESLEASIEDQLKVVWEAKALRRRGEVRLRNVAAIGSRDLKLVFTKPAVDVRFSMNGQIVGDAEDVPTVSTGQFHSFKIEAVNRGDVGIPGGTVMESHLLRDDGRGQLVQDPNIIVSGCTKSNGLPPLAPGVKHQVVLRARFLTRGVFGLQVRLSFVPLTSTALPAVETKVMTVVAEN